MKNEEIKQDFIKLFNTLTARHSKSEVWSDFVEMSACAISNVCDKKFFDIREQMYLSCAKKYSAGELDNLATLLSYVIMAFECNPEQDFLGEMFGSLRLSDAWKGQYFTPYHIGRFMGDINSYGAESSLATKEVISVSDCCCGSGCLLIAFANSLHRKKINFQKKVFFFAQDIDLTAALMCYIHLSLLGCMAVVKVGNSLSDPFVENEPISEKLWFTPMACFRNYHINIK